jgi:hypothetical protein
MMTAQCKNIPDEDCTVQEYPGLKLQGAKLSRMTTAQCKIYPDEDRTVQEYLRGKLRFTRISRMKMAHCTRISQMKTAQHSTRIPRMKMAALYKNIPNEDGALYKNTPDEYGAVYKNTPDEDGALYKEERKVSSLIKTPACNNYPPPPPPPPQYSCIQALLFTRIYSESACSPAITFTPTVEERIQASNSYNTVGDGGKRRESERSKGHVVFVLPILRDGGFVRYTTY